MGVCVSACRGPAVTPPACPLGLTPAVLCRAEEGGQSHLTLYTKKELLDAANAVYAVTARIPTRIPIATTVPHNSAWPLPTLQVLTLPLPTGEVRYCLRRRGRGGRRVDLRRQAGQVRVALAICVLVASPVCNNKKSVNCIKRPSTPADESNAPCLCSCSVPRTSLLKKLVEGTVLLSRTRESHKKKTVSFIFHTGPSVS